jgi:hypothetical protein
VFVRAQSVVSQSISDPCTAHKQSLVLVYHQTANRSVTMLVPEFDFRIVHLAILPARPSAKCDCSTQIFILVLQGAPPNIKSV